MARRRDDSATEPVIRVLATERAMEILIDSQTLRQRLWYSARLYGVHSGSVSSPSAMPYLTNVRMKSSVSGSTKPPPILYTLCIKESYYLFTVVAYGGV